MPKLGEGRKERRGNQDGGSSEDGRGQTESTESPDKLGKQEAGSEWVQREPVASQAQ